MPETFFYSPSPVPSTGFKIPSKEPVDGKMQITATNVPQRLSESSMVVRRLTLYGRNAAGDGNASDVLYGTENQQSETITPWSSGDDAGSVLVTPDVNAPIDLRNVWVVGTAGDGVWWVGIV